MTVHHTAVLLDDNAQAPGRLRQHQRYHVDQLGWPDIAYHVAVDLHGHIYELRDTGMAGDTATDYDPTGHLLVVCEGNFEQQTLPASQFESLARVLAWGSAAFDCDASSIAGHVDYTSSTRCPGVAIQQRVSDGSLEQRVRELLYAGGVELNLTCGREAQDIVTEVERGRA